MPLGTRRFVNDVGSRMLLLAAACSLVAPALGAWGGTRVGATALAWLAAACQGASLTTGMCTVASMVLVAAFNAGEMPVTPRVMTARRIGRIVSAVVITVAIIGIGAELTLTDLSWGTRLGSVAIRISSATAAAVAFWIAGDHGP